MNLRRLVSLSWLDAIAVATALILAAHVTSAVARGAEQPATPNAEQMMIDAHQARAVWDDFPGFSADVAVATDSKVVRGQLTVTADGEVLLKMPDPTGIEWAQRRLESVVQHRMPASDGAYDVDFADDETEHPLGRLIQLNDDGLHSRYRIQGDVFTEVHHSMGPTRFTISVLDVSRNPEGKYLPHEYSIGYWESQSGKLIRSESFHSEWVRMGKLDLPFRLLGVTTENDGKRTVTEIRLTDHKLLDSVAAK